MRNRPVVVFFLAIVLAGFGLSACGQKGPLVPPKAYSQYLGDDVRNVAPDSPHTLAATPIS